jgi:hypothetical protein
MKKAMRTLLELIVGFLATTALFIVLILVFYLIDVVVSDSVKIMFVLAVFAGLALLVSRDFGKSILDRLFSQRPWIP